MAGVNTMGSKNPIARTRAERAQEDAADQREGTALPSPGYRHREGAGHQQEGGRGLSVSR